MSALLPTSKLAAELGLSQHTVRQKLASGDWPAMWTGGQWLGDVAEIRAAMATEAAKRRGEPENVTPLRPARVVCTVHAECVNRLSRAPQAVPPRREGCWEMTTDTTSRGTVAADEQALGGAQHGLVLH